MIRLLRYNEFTNSQFIVVDSCNGKILNVKRKKDQIVFSKGSLRNITPQFASMIESFSEDLIHVTLRRYVKNRTGTYASTESIEIKKINDIR